MATARRWPWRCPRMPGEMQCQQQRWDHSRAGGTRFWEDGDGLERSLFLQSTAGLQGRHNKASERGSGMRDVCPA